MASDLAGPSHRHRAIYEVRHQRFRCPNSDGNCLGSSKLWDSRTRASVHLLGTGKDGADERAFARNQIGVAHGRLTQSSWSCPSSSSRGIQGLECTVAKTYATASRCMTNVFGTSASRLTEISVARSFRRGQPRWTESEAQWGRTRTVDATGKNQDPWMRVP